MGKYNEELARIIKNKFDGSDLNWSSELDNGFFYFAISYQGLLLNKTWRPETVFIEWNELEDILAPEIKSDVLKYAAGNNE